MKNIILNAEKRSAEKSTRAELIRKKETPAIVYGHKVTNQQITLDSRVITDVFAQVGTSSLIDLKIAKSKPVSVIIQEIQLDPVSDEIVHVDFYQVKKDVKIKTEIPLKFTNKSPAVEDDGGNLIIDRQEIEIECLPADLIDKIIVDISALKTFDDVIRIKDLETPDSITVLDKDEEVVATTTAPRTTEEMEALDEDPTESDVEDVDVEDEKEAEDDESEESSEADDGDDKKPDSDNQDDKPKEEVKEQ